MSNSFFGKIVAVLTSFFLAVAAFFGLGEAMLDYAEKDGETLVVVTADHETGGITLTDGVYAYKNGSHSGVDVPLFVLGSEDIIADGETVDNYEIPIRIAYAPGFTEEQFPVSVDK